jgi:diguanylate cyclase (GGDEF)-like protein
LVLLDVVMPGIDGYEVCRQLKADPITALIPIIFVTAHFDEADEVRGFELGAVDFIHKPINPLITQMRVRNQLLIKQQADLLRSIALNDGLTGIANRRKFDANLETQWQHCQRNAQPLSLLMLDVDFFKRYNDHYGHQQGDICLQEIARTLEESLQRPLDLAARYGGEEFALILPHTDMKGASYIADKILLNVQNLGLEHQTSDAADWVTLSIGAATITPTAAANPTQLLSAADQQLYLAKSAGRAQLSATLLS